MPENGPTWKTVVDWCVMIAVPIMLGVGSWVIVKQIDHEVRITSQGNSIQHLKENQFTREDAANDRARAFEAYNARQQEVLDRLARIETKLDSRSETDWMKQFQQWMESAEKPQ